MPYCRINKFLNCTTFIITLKFEADSKNEGREKIGLVVIKEPTQANLRTNVCLTRRQGSVFKNNK